jgi:hypothetical protein
MLRSRFQIRHRLVGAQASPTLMALPVTVQKDDDPVASSAELVLVRNALLNRLAILDQNLKRMIVRSEVARQRKVVEGEPQKSFDRLFETVYLEVQLLCREYEDAQAVIRSCERLTSSNNSLLLRQIAQSQYGAINTIAEKITEAEARRKAVERRFNLRGANFQEFFFPPVRL